MPVQGPIPGKEAASPLYGIKHKGQDAIFALACNYPKLYYERFVGTLRHAGYEDDIVLAVSPEPKMKPGLYSHTHYTHYTLCTLYTHYTHYTLYTHPTLYP